jgi:hypothetical protein
MREQKALGLSQKSYIAIFTLALILTGNALTHGASTARADSALPPVTHSFLANVYVNKAMEGGFSYSADRVEQVEINSTGTLTATDFTVAKNKDNTLIAVGKNGFVTHYFIDDKNGFSIKGFLNVDGKYTKVGLTTNYVEPGTLDNKNQYIYGRKVRDGVNSKQIVRQSVKTGALSYHFDTTKNGGGSVCGIATDSKYKLAFFTHLLPSKTVLYSFDLNNGKYKKVQELAAGFCIDTVIDSKRFAGVKIDVKAEKWDSNNIIFVDLSKGKSLIPLEIPFELKWISEHQMLVAGNYLYLNEPFDRRDNTVQSPGPVHFYIDLNQPLGDPASIIEVAGGSALFGQYSGINYVPVN